MKFINKALTSLMPCLPKWVARPFARPYVAGESLEEVLRVVKKLNETGFAATVDILGEHTSTQKEAKEIHKSYELLIKSLSSEKLDSTISVKLSHLGLTLKNGIAEKNIMSLAKIGKEYNIGLCIDMENSQYTSETFKIYNLARDSYDRLGTVIQAYLYRSSEDLHKLNSKNLNIRICKGIYNESSKIAIKEFRAINNNYLTLAKQAFAGKGYVCLATHDIFLIDELVKIIINENISVRRFEFQVLYGVPMSKKLKELKDRGYKVRIYVPYGKAWFEYSVRRLKENPKIISYVLGNYFKS